MEELKKEVSDFQEKLSSAASKREVESLGKKRAELNQGLEELWATNHKEASARAKEISVISKKIDPLIQLQGELNYIKQLIDLGDSSIKDEVHRQLKDLEEEYVELSKELQFTEPYDDHDVILNIYAGAGGTDAQDWAQMLERMYLRWAEKSGIKASVVEESPGEEAGIKSATLELTGGAYLYGKLAGEHGVHRLVRKSPFNSAGSRETSFAKVDVLPLVDKPGELEIDDKDLKIDVYRAGGHGGQSVNTTDSAVRVTHLPTGISVAIQNERSQLQNKETALGILRSRLAQLQMEQHAATLADIKGPNQAVEFGSQIRNYILDDRIVKDLRTGYETHDPQKILDGDIDPLIDAWLQKH